MDTGKAFNVEKFIVDDVSNTLHDICWIEITREREREILDV